MTGASAYLEDISCKRGACLDNIFGDQKLTKRRYYKSVPELRKDDNILPPASEIPKMISNTRKRTVSVGPQSEADVREYIANREQKRRESLSSASTARRPHLNTSNSSPPGAYQKGNSANSSQFNETADGHLSPAPPSTARTGPDVVSRSSSTSSSNDSGKEDEMKDRNMFSALEKPRIRYDVEVITKVVVYAGIAWLAVEGNPLLFGWSGLA
jgi:hypothetical protein